LQQHSDESEKWEAGNLHAGDSFHVHRGGIPGGMGDSINDQAVSFGDTAIGPEPDSTANNSSDRKNEVKNVQGNNGTDRLSGNPVFYGLSGQSNEQEISAGVNQNDRAKETETLFQEPEFGIQRGAIPADSFSGLDTGPDNRGVNFEVKNDQALESFTGSNSDNRGNNYSGQLGQINDSNPSDYFGLVAPSARLTSPANQANFDNGDYPVPHVQNEQENNQSATCAKSPEVEEKPNRLTGRELTEWAIKNYAVDPIQSSKNRWKIRLRCRKTGCKHEGHLGLKTVSFMSDSVFKKLTRSERKYELWKKAILAENAAALRQGN